MAPTSTDDDFFQGETYDPVLDGKRLGRQLLSVEQTMSDGRWRSLKDIAWITKSPEASVSARLRDLRRMGWVVQKRRLTPGTWIYRAEKLDRGMSHE
jgi:hypothetical protein